MATIKDRIMDHLDFNGLDSVAVQEVFTNMQQSIPEMEHRWEDDVEGYPALMLELLLGAANRRAVEWIDSHQPQHWARDAFRRDSEGV